MNGLVIVAALGVLLLAGTLVALWLAPEGEETEAGFRAVGPSRFQRFWERLGRRWWRRSRVGNLNHDPHP